jgi:hypothetical protein
MANSADSVDIAGTWLNMHDNGFTLFNNICELVDNSLGAQAKYIHIYVDASENKFTIANDQKGMTQDELTQAFVLNKRSLPGEEKHGRYGYGGKQAMSFISDNGKVCMISKWTAEPQVISGDIHEVKLDISEVIKKGVYRPQAHEVSRGSFELWKKFAIKDTDTGTVIQMHTTTGFIQNLAESILTKDVTASILYQLAITYGEIISSGQVSMKITYKDKALLATTYPVFAVDPLFCKTLKYKLDMRLLIYENPDNAADIRVYFPHGGKMNYRSINPESGMYKNWVSNPPAGANKLTEMRLRIAYAKDWVSVQKPFLAPMGLGITDTLEKDTAEDFFGGIYYNRNKKLLARFPTARPSSGNFAYRSVKVNTHIALDFTASAINDRLISVTVNKSKLVEENIQRTLRETIRFVHDSVAKDIYRSSEIAAIIEPTITTDGPSVAQPVLLAQPVLAQPVLAQPVLAQPVLAQPVLAQPILARPVPSKVQPTASAKAPAKQQTTAPAQQKPKAPAPALTKAPVEDIDTTEDDGDIEEIPLVEKESYASRKRKIEEDGRISCFNKYEYYPNKMGSLTVVKLPSYKGSTDSSINEVCYTGNHGSLIIHTLKDLQTYMTEEAYARYVETDGLKKVEDFFNSAFPRNS